MGLAQNRRTFQPWEDEDMLLSDHITLDSNENIFYKKISFTASYELQISNDSACFALLFVFCTGGDFVMKDDFDQKITTLKAGFHLSVQLMHGNFKFSSTESKSKMSYLLIEDILLEKYLPENHVFLAQLPQRTNWNQLQYNTTAKLHSILQELDLLHTAKNYANEILIEAKKIELFGAAIALYETQLKQQLLKPSDIGKMVVVRDLIVANLDQNFTIDELAKLAGTNKQYLKKNFKIAYQNTIAQYMLACKMNKSKELLITGKNTITEVSQFVGYKHTTHFSHAFEKFFGQTPKMLKGNTDS